MRKIAVVLLSLFTFIGTALAFYPTSASADNNDPSTPTCTITINSSRVGTSNDTAPIISANEIADGNAKFNVTVNLSPEAQNLYNFCGGDLRISVGRLLGWNNAILTSAGARTFTGLLSTSTATGDAVRNVDVEIDGKTPTCTTSNTPICQRGYVVLDPNRIEDGETGCSSEKDRFTAGVSVSPKMVEIGQSVRANFSISQDLINSCSVFITRYRIERSGESQQGGNLEPSASSISYTPDYPGQYSLIIDVLEKECTAAGIGGMPVCGSGDLIVRAQRNFCAKSPGDPDCTPNPDPDDGKVEETPFVLCGQAANDIDLAKCETCVVDPIDPQGMWTAIGCIPIEPTSVIQTFITIGLSLGGGLTLLLILAGAFRLSVSAGDPKQAEEAKEQITSALIGLLFIIFSITMLRFIGVQVLQIPGFGG